jgi:CHAD domain-containing protein
VSASELLDAALTSGPARVDQAARRYIAAIKQERLAIGAQDKLNDAAMQNASISNVTQEQIDQAGKTVKACRLTAVAALAVLEQECDR